MPTSQKFDLAMEFTKKWEGGLVNDKYDRGGKTKYGISQVHNPDVDVESLTYDEAKSIYKERYYDINNIDSLPLALAVQVFDYSVNSGPNKAARDLQRILSVKVDGKIGDETIAALDDADQEVLLGKYLKARENNYIRIISNDPTQKRFQKGWYNRLRALAATTT